MPSRKRIMWCVGGMGSLVAQLIRTCGKVRLGFEGRDNRGVRLEVFCEAPGIVCLRAGVFKSFFAIETAYA